MNSAIMIHFLEDQIKGSNFPTGSNKTLKAKHEVLAFGARAHLQTSIKKKYQQKKEGEGKRKKGPFFAKNEMASVKLLKDFGDLKRGKCCTSVYSESGLWQSAIEQLPPSYKLRRTHGVHGCGYMPPGPFCNRLVSDSRLINERHLISRLTREGTPVMPILSAFCFDGETKTKGEKRVVLQERQKTCIVYPRHTNTVT